MKRLNTVCSKWSKALKATSWNMTRQSLAWSHAYHSLMLMMLMVTLCNLPFNPPPPPPPPPTPSPLFLLTSHSFPQCLAGAKGNPLPAAETEAEGIGGGCEHANTPVLTRTHTEWEAVCWTAGQQASRKKGHGDNLDALPCPCLHDIAR